MLELEPELLRVLIAFAESKTMIEAAAKLQITQPAVTQRLKRLEGQLPIPISTFQGRNKVLTHYGRALYEVAKSNLSHLERNLENINRIYATGAQLVMRVGGRSDLFEIFGHAVQFLGRVDYSSMDRGKILESIENQEIDVGIVNSVIHSPDLVSKKLFEGPCRFISHPKLMPAVHSLRDIQKQKDILLSTPSILNKSETTYSNKFFLSLKIDATKLNCKALVEDWSALQTLVASAEGYGIVPGYLPRPHKHILSFEIPHSLVPHLSYYIIFDRKLKKIDAFQKALAFSVHSS